ncbi:MAG: collagen-like protein, partial [Treponema sp.]|nr:collagen-like protein [Treponema sp.]
YKCIVYQLSTSNPKKQPFVRGVIGIALALPICCFFAACEGPMGPQGLQGIQGEKGDPGNDGISIVWKGELGAAPTGQQLYWAYFNTTTGNAYIYTGAAWELLAQRGATGTQGSAGTAGISISWQGTHASDPAEAQLNWAYYNSTDKKSYIYNGTAWQILAQDGEVGPAGPTGPEGPKGDKGDKGDPGNNDNPGQIGNGHDPDDGINVVWDKQWGDGNATFDDIIAMIATERYEVAFYHAATAQVYRTSWTDGQKGALWIPAEVDYAANGNGAILLAGTFDRTLLAIGQLSAVDGVQGVTTITAATRNITFTLTALTKDIYGWGTNGPNNPAASTFQFIAHNGAADWDVYLNNTGGGFTAFNTAAINGFAYPVFALPQNAVFQASYQINFGTHTAGIVIASTPSIRSGIVSAPDYYSAVDVTGIFNPITFASGNALPMSTPFLMELTTRSNAGLIRISIEIPVHAWSNVPQQGNISLSTVQPGTWYIRGGIENNSLFGGISAGSTGGAILLGIGDYAR